jgi:FtsZ-binding cell division protein ZapB
MNRGDLMMELLAELEKKVLELIQRNKSLQEEAVSLKEKNNELEMLQLQVEEEAAGNKSSSEELREERLKIRNSIEDLLGAIRSFDSVEGCSKDG